MTPTQFRAALDRLGLSQLGAARLFGVDGSTVRRWAKDGVDGTVVILLRLMLAGKVTEQDIRTVATPEQKSKVAKSLK